MIPFKKGVLLAPGLVVLTTVAVLVGTRNVGASPSLNGAAAAALPSRTPGLDMKKNHGHLVADGRSFSLPPNPNIAFEFDLPSDVVLTDVQLSLNAPALAATVFVSDFSTDQTFIFQSVGSPGSTFAGSTEGHASIHLESGLLSPSGTGLRVGLYCNNIGGNSCSGALMWSGYRQGDRE